MSPRVRSFDPEAFLRQLWAMDAALVDAGFPPTSPWWRAQIERFVRALAHRASQGRRGFRWVIRVGRRGGKSSTLCRLAVAWAWFGPWDVPLGDTAVVPFTSTSRDEASSRLRTVAAILKALGLPHDVRGEEIDLGGERAVLFKVFSATVRGTVGFTSIMAAGDEVARWESRETGANPAREVIGSLMPTLATQPFGFAVWCSSPWGTDDYHAELFDQGDDEHQVVSFAETWVANPTLTEEDTHALEPDERIWSREYAAQPGATLSAAFDPEDLAGCFRPLPGELTSPFLCIDASSLRGDTFAWARGGRRGETLVVSELGGWDASAQRRTSMDAIVTELAQKACQLSVPKVFGDQREEAALRSLFRQHDVVFESFAWTETSKDDAMQLLRRLQREKRLVLPEHAQLRAQCERMKARMLPSGRTRYETGGLDFASTLITLAHAVVDERYQLAQHDPGPMVISIPSERQCGRSSSNQYNELRAARLARWRAAGIINDDD